MSKPRIIRCPECWAMFYVAAILKGIKCQQCGKELRIAPAAKPDATPAERARLRKARG